MVFFIGASHTLDDGADALTQANAHGRQAKLRVLLFHYIKQSRSDSRTRTAKWVTQRNRTAIVIDDVLLIQQIQAF